jgi:uncharacterized Ntn-hydrolase superfamily protein
MNNLCHTFSVVARDPLTGHMGVAVQSHWFAVGSICPWAEAGTGAIATQALVETSYGPLGLDLLRSGKTATQALAELLANDKRNEIRQVAIVDGQGIVATHTGKSCISEAGHVIGAGYSVQANMMKNSTVWSAMSDAFQHSQGDLAERMMATLNAAQAAGGDIRGKQSACLLIVDQKKTEKPWENVIFNIRVDDHPEPLIELAHLIKVQRAYHLMNEGDELLGQKKFEAAMQKYQAAEEFAPHIDEIPFWVAITLADMGKLDNALPIFSRVFKLNPDWAELVKRLPKSGLLRDDAEMMQRIQGCLK